VALSNAAHATGDFCAVVLKTPDGFLALREKPGRESKIIAKLREGDFLYAGTEQCSQSVCDTEARKWTHINGVPRIDGPNDPKKTYDDYTHGWVSRKYIQDFLCPEDQQLETKVPEKPHQNLSDQAAEVVTCTGWLSETDTLAVVTDPAGYTCVVSMRGAGHDPKRPCAVMESAVSPAERIALARPAIWHRRGRRL
jgi:hypothetical protein